MSQEKIDQVREYVLNGIKVLPVVAPMSVEDKNVFKNPDTPSLAKTGNSGWASIKDDNFVIDEKIINTWFDPKKDQGIGLILGSASLDLFCLDIEYRDFVEQMTILIEEKLPELVGKYPIVTTPGKEKDKPGGSHFYFKFPHAKMEKLALISDEESKERTGESGHTTAIECRANGGYMLAPGSHPNAHPSRKTYTLETTDIPIWSAPVLTFEQYEMIIKLAKSLNKEGLMKNASIQEEDKKDQARSDSNIKYGDRVGDQYLKFGPSMYEIVQDHFKVSRSFPDGTIYLTRHGKERGVSAKIVRGFAKTDPDKELLFVYTSNAPPFRSFQCYDKLGAQALVWGCTFSEAIKRIASVNKYKVDHVKNIENDESVDTSKLADIVKDKTGLKPISNLSVLDFPIEVFPPSIQTFLRQLSVSINKTPIDYCATQMMAICSIAIGKSRVIEIKRGHQVFCNMFLVVIAKPGDGKTGVLKALRKQVDALEARYGVLFKHAMEQYQDLVETEGELQTKAPTRQRATAMKATVEALSTILSQNPRGIGIIRDEISGLMTSMNQYKGGGGEDREAFLEFWSNQTQIIDRKSQEGIPVEIKDPFLTILGGTQPDKVELFLSGVDDGFSERFLYCYPDKNAEPGYSTVEVDEYVEKKWIDLFAHLSNLEFDTGVMRDNLGNPILDDSGNPVMEPVPKIVRLSDEAKKIHADYILEIDQEVLKSNFDERLRGTYMKIKDYFRKFALIIHEIRVGCSNNTMDAEYWVANENEVDEISMLFARHVADYFLSHARRARLVASRNEYENMLYKLAKFVQEHHDGSCGVKTAYMNCRSIRNSIKGKNRGVKFFLELFQEMENRLWGELSEDQKAFTIYKKSNS